MNRYCLLLSGLVLFLALGCADPKKTVLPSDASTWEKELKPTLEKLSDQDRQIVGRYMMRSKMAEAFGGTSKLGTVTIEEAIAEQLNIEATQKAKEAEEKKLADKLRAEREEFMKKVDQTLSVVLVSKKVRAADPMNGGDFSDSIIVTLGFQNKSTRDISGFKGELKFLDMFGDTIKKIKLSHDETVPAMKTVTWTGKIDFNQFMAEDQKLRDADESKLKLQFEPAAIIFQDGTKLEVAPDLNIK
ncbi:MAG: hypothetical protein WCK51_12615 [Armatimonadota bacterium]|jgi:hypothetical protein